MTRAVADVPAITDDLPLLEYTRAYPPPAGLPADLFDVTRVSSWCPSCVAPDGTVTLPGLEPYLKVMDLFYRSSASDRVKAVLAERGDPFGSPLAASSLEQIVDRNAYLRSLLVRH
jgi:hypothetical protein